MAAAETAVLAARRAAVKDSKRNPLRSHSIDRAHNPSESDYIPLESLMKKWDITQSDVDAAEDWEIE